MALKKIRHSLNVERIYVRVTCPECGGTVAMKMRGPVTRKTCPKCNHCTYLFSITPLRGYVRVEVLTIGRDETPTEYDLSPDDVEIIEDGDNDQPIMEE